MRVIYDVTSLSHPRTGIGNYIRGALRGMAEAAGGRHELVAFAPASARGRPLIESALEGIPVGRRLVTLPLAHPLRRVWTRLGWPPAERFLGRFDVLHYGDWMQPPQRAGIRATIVHDLVPLRFPEWVHPRTRRLHLAMYRDLPRCDVIFANSSFTARDLVERLGIREERITVVRPGVEPHFRPEGERAELDRPYVFTVATLEPRKNLGTLAEAHRLLDGGLALAVAGGGGWGARPEFEGGAVRLGYVPHDQLPRWYRGAAVAVYPSRFEGFGMPVVEAMACGVPCVASGHPSLDEACGDAAVRADPDDPEALAAAIERALAERDALVAKGLVHARRFSWRAAGETMLAAYAEAL